MEKVSYLDLPNCYKLSNADVELIVTTDMGPRVIRYGFRDAESMLGEVPGDAIETELGSWHPLGGHRLWAAPEMRPRTYAPDNEPVDFQIEDERTIRLRPPIEAATRLQKELLVTLDESGARVRLVHRITNRNFWTIELAPWALTIMNGGGEVVIPQEPYRSWADELAPARPLVLWHYTDLNDPRFHLGAKFLRLRTRADLAAPQKVGVLNKQGWAAYRRGTTLFVKSVPYVRGAAYPDYNCNTQTYTAASFIELETLAPLQHLAPGETAEHVEEWFLFRLGDDAGIDHEEGLSAALMPHVARVLDASR